MDLNAPRFCVQNFLPQGLSILGGAPKMGKSWLVLDLCVRITKGEAIWNMETTKGTTLYLCLEDPYFRIQQRLGCITDEAPPDVFFANAASTLAEDLEQQIIEFVKDHAWNGEWQCPVPQRTCGGTCILCGQPSCYCTPRRRPGR